MDRRGISGLGGGIASVTIRHLLDMESGVSLPIDLSNPQYNWTDPAFRRARHVSARFMRAAGLFRKLPDEPPDEGEFDFLPTLAQECPHGDRPFVGLTETSEVHLGGGQPSSEADCLASVSSAFDGAQGGSAPLWAGRAMSLAW